MPNGEKVADTSASTAKEEPKAAGNAASETTKNPRRRGVGTARGPQRLKFSDRDAKTYGLFLGHIDSIQLTSITIGEDTTGMPSFNGLEIPRVVITFASNETDLAQRKYNTLTFTAVESNTETIPGGKNAWHVDRVFDYMKHVLNVFVLKGKAMTEEQEDALALPFMDFDDDGMYVPVEVEEVIAGWKAVFENFVTIMNTVKDGKPAFTHNGQAIAIWGKMIRYYKTPKKGWQAVNRGDLSFPTYVGEGVFEIFNEKIAPSIKVETVKECIYPMKIDEPKAPNMPGIGGGSAPMYGGGVPMAGDYGPAGGVADSPSGMYPGDDLPF